MGNKCCKVSIPSDYDPTNIDEFYDPLAQFKSLAEIDPFIIAQHGLRGVDPLTELPRELDKL